jgi:anti-sigma factor (TIGR02949 family)
MTECEEVKRLMDVYLDGEFDEEEADQIRTHILNCPSCLEVFEQHQQFLSLLKENESEEEVPRGLEFTIRSKLRRVNPQKQGKSSFLTFQLASVAALIVLTLLGSSLYFILQGPSLDSDVDDAFMTEVVSTYKSYLKQELPLEIQSTQIEEVTEWFKNKANLSLKVPSFQSKDVELIGARLTRFEGRQVALLIYKLDDFIIFLAIIPEGTSKVHIASKNPVKDSEFFRYNIEGYKGVYWNRQGLTYCLVSNLPEDLDLHLVE